MQDVEIEKIVFNFLIEMKLITPDVLLPAHRPVDSVIIKSDIEPIVEEPLP